MPQYKPTAVIGQWTTGDKRRGFMLQANGDLVTVEREHQSDMWSPPRFVGNLEAGEASFEAFLHSITRDVV